MLSSFADELEKIAEGDDSFLEELRQQRRKSREEEQRSVRPGQIAKSVALAAGAGASMPFALQTAQTLGDMESGLHAVSVAKEHAQLYGYARSLGYNPEESRAVASSIQVSRANLPSPGAEWTMKQMTSSPAERGILSLFPNKESYQDALRKGEAYLGEKMPSELKLWKNVAKREVVTGVKFALPFALTAGLATLYAKLQHRKQLKKQADRSS